GEPPRVAPQRAALLRLRLVHADGATVALVAERRVRLDVVARLPALVGAGQLADRPLGQAGALGGGGRLRQRPPDLAREAALQLVQVGALAEGAAPPPGPVVHDAERDAQVGRQAGRVPRLPRDGHAR